LHTFDFTLWLWWYLHVECIADRRCRPAMPRPGKRVLAGDGSGTGEHRAPVGFRTAEDDLVVGRLDRRRTVPIQVTWKLGTRSALNVSPAP
jgi:hypothetical protein